MSKEISLTNSDKVAIVDDVDFESLNKHKWLLSQRGDVESRINGKRLKIHRVIMQVKNPLEFIDHIDGNKLNNSRSNLRIVDNKTNTRNRHKKNPSYSQYFGVTLDKRTNLKKRWVAQIKVDYIRIYLGRFETEKEAAEAYNKKAKELGYLTRNVL